MIMHGATSIGGKFHKYLRTRILMMGVLLSGHLCRGSPGMCVCTWYVDMYVCMYVQGVPQNMPHLVFKDFSFSDSQG